MGESAESGLALLTVQALIARQLPVPRGVIVLSPLFFPYYPEARRTLHNIHKWIQTIFI
jgi:hypothetical protein